MQEIVVLARVEYVQRYYCRRTLPSAAERVPSLP